MKIEGNVIIGFSMDIWDLIINSGDSDITVNRLINQITMNKRYDDIGSL